MSVSIWVAAIMTLCVFTFLHRDNPVFRFAESLFAGVSLGYFIGLVLNQTLKPNLFGPLRDDFFGNWDLLFAAAIGILLYARYVPKIAWLSRWALAAYIGYYVGVTMVQKLQGEVVPQMISVLRNPINTFDQDGFNHLVSLLGTLSVLVYFFFSKKHEGMFGRIAMVGIWFLMISFGAAFGYTVMGRVSLLIGRFNFLVNDWLRPLFGA
jgi:hypothetical protein